MSGDETCFMDRRRALGLGAAGGLGVCLGGCRWAGAAGSGYINGAGSTFVYPLMSRWSSEYNRLHPEVRVNYQSIGSGGGIRQLISRTVRFGASDGPMTDTQLREAGAPIVHVPLVMGAVVPSYNLPRLPRPIRFTPEVLAGIFLGRITTWNDPRIAEANPGLALPALPVVVVHRSDGSGTTYVWTDYLSKVSPEWRTRAGKATSVNWPTGLGGRGNEGVAGTVRQTPGAMGYVELTFALQNAMPVGEVRNRHGQFVTPSIESVTAAAASVVAAIPEDLRYSITDAPGEAAWPVSGTTWGLLYGNLSPGLDRRALVGFLRWVLRGGQRYCAPLHYAPLPAELAERAERKLTAIEPLDPPAGANR